MTNEKEVELINLFEETMCSKCVNKNCNRRFEISTIYAPVNSVVFGNTFCIKCNEYKKELV